MAILPSLALNLLLLNTHNLKDQCRGYIGTLPGFPRFPYSRSLLIFPTDP